MGLAFSAETSVIRNQETLKEPEKFTWSMTKKWFVDSGKQMYRSGKGFGKEIVVVEDQEGVGRISSPKQANPKSHAA